MRMSGVCLYDRIQYSLKRVAVRLVQVPGAGVLVHAIAALHILLLN